MLLDTHHAAHSFLTPRRPCQGIRSSAARGEAGPQQRRIDRAAGVQRNDLEIGIGARGQQHHDPGLAREGRRRPRWTSRGAGGHAPQPLRKGVDPRCQPMNTQLYDCSFSNRAFRKNLRERQHERLRWILDILGRQRLVQHPFVGAGTRAASVSPCRLTPGQTALAGGRSRRRSREWRNGTARRPSANPPSDGTVRSGIARRSERSSGDRKPVPGSRMPVGGAGG